MLFRALFRSNLFFSVSQRININQKIKSSKTIAEVNKVFNQHHKDFDKIHHLFFLRRSLFFNPIPTNNAIQSIKYLQQKLGQISNDSFCLFVYHTMDSNLDVNIKEFHNQIDKRHKQFTIKNINLLLTSFGRYKHKFENTQSSVQLLTKNINLAKIQQGIDLINLLQNLNESGKISKSLNKGIIGKLSVISGWYNLRNINVLLKTILTYNLDQNISFMEKGLEETISKSYQTKNLIILLYYLSKFHQPNMELVNKILKRIKQLGQYRKKQISDAYSKLNETLEQQSQNKLDTTQIKPIKIENIYPQEFNMIEAINILVSMNRLSLYDNELFQISQQVFFQKLNSISQQNLVLFLNSHRGFCLRLIEKIGIENKDYNRKVNNVKEYYNNFYLKVFTFMKTKDFFNLVYVYQVLKAAQGMYFTNNDTKQMAINLANQKLDSKLLKDQQVKQLFEILDSYKRLPNIIIEMKKKIRYNDSKVQEK